MERSEFHVEYKAQTVYTCLSRPRKYDESSNELNDDMDER